MSRQILYWNNILKVDISDEKQTDTSALAWAPDQFTSTNESYSTELSGGNYIARMTAMTSLFIDMRLRIQ